MRGSVRAAWGLNRLLLYTVVVAVFGGLGAQVFTWLVDWGERVFAVASAITIGPGGAAGREGPTAQISAGAAPIPLSRRSGISPPPEPAWLMWFLKTIRFLGTPFYGFEGLDAFKAKFRQDRWEPIYAIINAGHISPRLLYVIGRAFSGASPMIFLLRLGVRPLVRDRTQ